MTRPTSNTIPAMSGRRQSDLFGPTKDSDEDRFWLMAGQMKRLGIAKSQAGMLAKQNNGDFAAGIRQLLRAASAREPTAYLGKIISTLKDGQNTAPRAGEPAFVAEWRADGFEIIKRRDGTYKIAGDIYDKEGHLIGF